MNYVLLAFFVLMVILGIVRLVLECQEMKRLKSIHDEFDRLLRKDQTP